MNRHPYPTLWAVLSVDRNGNEGICLISGPHGPVLAVTGDESILKIYKDTVSSMDALTEAHAAGLKIVIGEYQRVNTTSIMEIEK